jgi:hypothetical protein
MRQRSPADLRIRPRSEAPGFHDLVGFCASTHVNRRIELMADGHQQLPEFRSEPFVVAAAKGVYDAFGEVSVFSGLLSNSP